jgi:hypothetical protein
MENQVALGTENNAEVLYVALIESEEVEAGVQRRESATNTAGDNRGEGPRGVAVGNPEGQTAVWARGDGGGAELLRGGPGGILVTSGAGIDGD